MKPVRTALFPALAAPVWKATILTQVEAEVAVGLTLGEEMTVMKVNSVS